MKKEIKNNEGDNNKNTGEKNKKKEFWSLLEDKFYDLGKNFLKSGISSMAISQINNTEDKIKGQLEKKYKKYQSRILSIFALTVAGSFLSYGILEFILSKFNWEDFTNIVFGTIFLIGYFILKNIR